MDEFYELITAAQKQDPEFEKLSRMSGGMLIRRLIDVDDDGDNEGPSEEENEQPVFHVTLTSSGRLSIGYYQISHAAILSLLDTVRDIVKNNMEEDD